MGGDKRCLLLCCGLVTACASSDTGNRPPLVAPAPPQDVITVAGFDDAMHIGSDYIYAQKLPDRVFIGSQELPGNLWLLRFGPEGSGGAPVDLVIDAKSGTVVREVPAGAAAELKATPTAQVPSDTPVASPVEPLPPLLPSNAPPVPE